MTDKVLLLKESFDHQMVNRVSLFLHPSGDIELIVEEVEGVKSKSLFTSVGSHDISLVIKVLKVRIEKILFENYNMEVDLKDFRCRVIRPLLKFKTGRGI